MNLNILYEDTHMIVVEKPPKVPSQGDFTGDKDMLTYVSEHLQEQNPKMNSPYVGIIHRLDRPVGGIMVFAKTKFANQSLSEQIRQKKMQKEYYGVVCGVPPKDHHELVDHLLKNARLNLSKVVPKGTPNAKEASLSYDVLQTIETEEYGSLSYLKIVLHTGRHHQIRVQLSHAGIPLWGDNKYNETFVKQKGWTQIALWAGKLSFMHPKTNSLCSFDRTPEDLHPFSLFY